MVDRIAFGAMAGLVLLASAASAQTAPDYAADASWLCRPGTADVCASTDLTTTLIAADGSLTQEVFKPAANPKFDCFYVYPTISREPGGNSSMAIADEDRSVIQQQAARLASACRIFAPKYRSVTLAGLFARYAGKPGASDPLMAYGDVRAAWQYYLEHDNRGRGVVLVGHSQGATMLRRLIQQEIDGKPIQRRMISAMLLGVELAVPPGRDVGGDFQKVPLCHSARQTGCAVVFSSFRAEVPPAADALYGRIDRPDMFGTPPLPGMAAACVNPARPEGGAAVLDAYLSNRNRMVAGAPQPVPAWVTPPADITTAFIRRPGLLHGECVTSAFGTYLSVSLTPEANDHRTLVLPGDVVLAGKVSPAWGLHLIDVNLVMGDIPRMIANQARAWAARKAGER